MGEIHVTRRPHREVRGGLSALVTSAEIYKQICSFVWWRINKNVFVYSALDKDQTAVIDEEIQVLRSQSCWKCRTLLTFSTTYPQAYIASQIIADFFIFFFFSNHPWKQRNNPKQKNTHTLTIYFFFHFYKYVHFPYDQSGIDFFFFFLNMPQNGEQLDLLFFPPFRIWRRSPPGTGLMEGEKNGKKKGVGEKKGRIEKAETDGR